MSKKWQVWKGTRVATLLLLCPEALEVLIDFDPRLEQLRNAAKRRLVAHRLSIADIAYESGASVEEILSAIDKVLARQSRGARSAAGF